MMENNPYGAIGGFLLVIIVLFKVARTGDRLMTKRQVRYKKRIEWLQRHYRYSSGDAGAFEHFLDILQLCKKVDLEVAFATGMSEQELFREMVKALRAYETHNPTADKAELLRRADHAEQIKAYRRHHFPGLKLGTADAFSVA